MQAKNMRRRGAKSSGKASSTGRKNKRSGGGNGAAISGRVSIRSPMQITERSMPLFPARKKCMLRYASYGNLAGASGAVATQVYTANGLFDPDITSTGHQPMGFDQMMVSYNHYYVTSAKIIVNFKNVGTGMPQCSISVDPDATPITVPDRITEFGMVNETTCESKGVSGSVKTLEQLVSIRKAQGVKDVLDVTDLSGTAAANPTEQTYFHVQIWDNAAVTTNVNFDVVIEYHAIFTEPRVLTESERLMIHQFRLTQSKVEAKEKPKEKPCNRAIVVDTGLVHSPVSGRGDQKSSLMDDRVSGYSRIDKLEDDYDSIEEDMAKMNIHTRPSPDRVRSNVSLGTQTLAPRRRNHCDALPT